MSEVQEIHWDVIGGRIRAWREGQVPRVSLDRLADLLAEKGCQRPSAAKLSRIETGDHPAVPDILTALEDVTRIPAAEIRPDLAAMFNREPTQ